jgi:hypothetical protein
MYSNLQLAHHLTCFYYVGITARLRSSSHPLLGQTEHRSASQRDASRALTAAREDLTADSISSADAISSSDSISSPDAISSPDQLR